MPLERDTEALPTALPYYSSALSTCLASTPCISILSNGSLICSKWLLKMPYQLRNCQSDWTISSPTSLIASIRMSVDLFLKNTNCYFHSCWQPRYNLVTNWSTQKSGGIFWLDQQEMSRCLPTQPNGLTIILGLISTVSSMVWINFKISLASCNASWTMLISTDTSLILTNRIRKVCHSLGMRNWTTSKNWSSWRQLG